MPPFEIDEDLIRKLSALLEETGLGEIEYAEGECRIRVSRPATAAAFATAAAPPAEASRAAAGRAEEAAPAAEDIEGAVIAPMVGTVYIAPEPESPPFVRPGDTVTAGQTLLLIEAMKTFNPVRAPRDGRVAKVLVANATPVEYGEVLMILE